MVLFHFQYLYGGQSKLTWNIITGSCWYTYSIPNSCSNRRYIYTELSELLVLLVMMVMMMMVVMVVVVCVRACVRACVRNSRARRALELKTVASLTGKISKLPLCLL